MSASYIGFECSIQTLYRLSQVHKQIHVLRLCRNRIQNEQPAAKHLLNLPNEIIAMIELEIAKHEWKGLDTRPSPWVPTCYGPEQDSTVVWERDATMESFRDWTRQTHDIDVHSGPDPEGIDEKEYDRLESLFMKTDLWESHVAQTARAAYLTCDECPDLYATLWRSIAGKVCAESMDYVEINSVENAVNDVIDMLSSYGYKMTLPDVSSWDDLLAVWPIDCRCSSISPRPNDTAIPEQTDNSDIDDAANKHPIADVLQFIRKFDGGSSLAPLQLFTEEEVAGPAKVSTDDEDPRESELKKK